MNLKQIDAAIAAYQASLDEGDAARLDFFRGLWGALDGCTPQEAPAWTVPSKRDLTTWFAAGEPVFAHAPAEVDADAFAAALTAAASYAVEQGGFGEDVQGALERTKWERIVAASDLTLAGSDPAAYLETCVELLVDDGMSEQQARIGALLASLALRVQLEGPAASAAKALAKAGGDEPHPLTCPICGAAPGAARVGGENSTQGRGKTLWCGQCGVTWEFERVRCVRCGTYNQSHLHYFNIEGDDAHRIASCDECGGYMRTVYVDDALGPFSFEVEDVVMARLDAIAADPSFAGGKSAVAE